MTTRRQLHHLALATPLAWALPHATRAQAQAPGSPPGAAAKVLRYAFRVAETSFDPAAITDLYSRTIVAGILEAPLEYAFLERPFRMRPNTCEAMPEVADGYRRYVFRIRPGIFFADDPAFKGQRRELTAQDYVYSLKRHYDPRWKSGNLYLLENDRILGLSELRREALERRTPFDYDREVEGLRALDRYSFEVRLAEPKPRFLFHFTDGSFTGALAREVVEFYGDRIGEHPVGTGPFRLKDWKRSARIVLARNPAYREVRYDETPSAEADPALRSFAERMRGARLPLIDEVHISIIEENQPRWLSFLNHEQDVLEELPADFANLAIPNNRLAPHLAKQGIGLVRYPRADVALSYFAMENPVVGGYSAQQVALRRAISLATDVEREIRIVRRGQAIAAHGPLAPQTYGHDPALRSTMSEYSLARAKALLDLHGFVDRDGDGWRERPDGQPLQLDYHTQPDQQSRQLIELWQKNMDALGLRIAFHSAKWPENLKASRAGKLMMWGVGWVAGDPDADTFLALGYGPNKGQANHARFDLPAFNVLYERQRALPDGPERLALMRQAARLMIAYMPYKVHVHRTFSDLAHPWVQGYDRNLFVRAWWRYVDLDPAAQRGREREQRRARSAADGGQAG